MRKIEMEQIRSYEIPEPELVVVPLAEMFHLVIEDRERNKRELYGTPHQEWVGFNVGFGGYRKGELITVTGETGSGKTTWTLNWLMDAAKQKKPVLVITLENPIVSIQRKLCRMITGKATADLTKEELQMFYDMENHLPIYALNWHGPVQDKLILKCIHYAATKLGVEFVMLDHLDYIQKHREGWQNESYVIGDFVRNLAGVARQAQVAVALIAHPAKTQVRGLESREIGLDELKGSSSIKQESDAVLGVFRPSREHFETRLRLLKIREDEFSRYTGAFVDFEFDPDYANFRSLTNVPKWQEK